MTVSTIASEVIIFSTVASELIILLQSELVCVLFQNMETDETETETSSKEASEDSVTEEDKTMMGGGDGGDASLTLIQKYPLLFSFFLLLLFLLLEWVCERDRARHYMFDPYTCPLHTYWNIGFVGVLSWRRVLSSLYFFLTPVWCRFEG